MFTTKFIILNKKYKLFNNVYAHNALPIWKRGLKIVVTYIVTVLGIKFTKRLAYSPKKRTYMHACPCMEKG